MAADEIVYRLTDLIGNYNHADIKNDVMYLKEVIENEDRSRANVVLVDNLMDKYREEIMSKKKLVSLTDQEKHLYYYNPKLLCHRLYGHTELWHMLLEINEMLSVTQFCQEYIYVMTPGTIDKIFLEIINLEENNINQNAEEVNFNKNNYIQFKSLNSALIDL